MGRRGKYSLEQVKEWLQRYDSGQSIVDIADLFDVDPRTVRKYIKNMQGNELAQKAKVSVIREALIEHNREMIREVISIRYLVSHGKKVSQRKESVLYKALKAHLRHSPLWPRLDKWEETKSDETETRERLAKVLLDYLDIIIYRRLIPGKCRYCPR